MLSKKVLVICMSVYFIVAITLTLVWFDWKLMLVIFMFLWGSNTQIEINRRARK